MLIERSLVLMFPKLLHFILWGMCVYFMAIHLMGRAVNRTCLQYMQCMMKTPHRVLFITHKKPQHDKTPRVNFYSRKSFVFLENASTIIQGIQLLLGTMLQQTLCQAVSSTFNILKGIMTIN